MPRNERPEKKIVSHPAAIRLASYRAERERAQALAIDAAMTARRAGAAQDICDGGYEVLDR